MARKPLGDFAMFAGSVPGYHHTDANKNNQDGYTYGEVEVDGQIIRWGVLLDGCSAGARSDSGVQDALDYVERYMPVRLHELPVEEVPDQIFLYDLVDYIEFVAITKILGKQGAQEFLDGKLEIATHPRRKKVAQYIRDFYLFTVFGFIQTDTQVIIFHRGDGVIRVNDAVHYVTQGNQPLYPAYFAFPWGVAEKATAFREMTMMELQTKNVKIVMLGSDSWLRHKVLFDLLVDFAHLRRAVWLQGRLNVWSTEEEDPKLPDDPDVQSSVAKAFFDDTTAIALISTKEE